MPDPLNRGIRYLLRRDIERLPDVKLRTPASGGGIHRDRVIVSVRGAGGVRDTERCRRGVEAGRLGWNVGQEDEFFDSERRLGGKRR